MDPPQLTGVLEQDKMYATGGPSEASLHPRTAADSGLATEFFAIFSLNYT